MGFLDRLRRAGEAGAAPAVGGLADETTAAPTGPAPGFVSAPADRPSRDEQLEWLEESARELVAPALLGQDEVREALVGQYVEDDELDLTDADVGSVVELVWSERLRVEATWTDEGDYGRVRDAFAALETDGIVARMSFTCCQTCGHAEIDGERGVASRGYVFFDQQDAERLAPGGSDLFLAFGGYEVPDEVVAGEVVAALTTQGLAVEWDGTAAQRVLVSAVDWRKRVPPA
ncbi:MAG: hypothetical protein M3Y71_06125 [Actinomycetota bacterium]|nr:hypothetical protein [Actinomycetota bacterium]